jgi:integrase
MSRPRKPARLEQLGATWYILWHDGARDRRSSTRTGDRASAEEAFARWLAERGQSQPGGRRLHGPDSLSIGEAIGAWLEQHATGKASGSRDAQAAEFLLDWWGDRAIADISPETVAGYSAWRRETGRGTKGRSLSDTTIRLELATLRAALRWHIKHGRLTSVPHINMPPPPAARERWLTRSEAALLIAACKESYQHLFVLLALYTGARKQAILDLRWVQIDLDGGLIHLNPPGRRQTSKRRPPVPIAAPLREVLIAAKAAALTPWVIELSYDQAAKLTGRDKKEIKAEDLAPVGNVKKGFAAAVARAGLAPPRPWIAVEKQGRKKVERKLREPTADELAEFARLAVTPHTLRHTCGSWMAQAGVDMHQIAAWLGHTYARTTELYAHLSPDHLRRAAEALAG